MTPSQLKITFANHDNAADPVVLDVSGDMSLDSLRKAVLSRWPASSSKPEHAADVRMFCMGKILEAGSIAACALPAFDFPTPVHVVGKPSRKAIAAERKAEAAGECCCVIM